MTQRSDIARRSVARGSFRVNPKTPHFEKIFASPSRTRNCSLLVNSGLLTRGTRLDMSPIWAPKQDTKRKRPRLRGASASQRAVILRLAAELELAAFGLAKAGFALLGLQLA